MKCPQCGSDNARWYDGALGYEAVRCPDCHTETDANSGATCPYLLLGDKVVISNKHRVDNELQGRTGDYMRLSPKGYAIVVLDATSTEGQKVVLVHPESIEPRGKHA